MDSCASCGAALGEFQAFCTTCGTPSNEREVSLDDLLNGHSELPETPAPEPVEEPFVADLGGHDWTIPQEVEETPGDRSLFASLEDPVPEVDPDPAGPDPAGPDTVQAEEVQVEEPQAEAEEDDLDETDDDWGTVVPAGVPLRLIPLRDAPTDQAPPTDRPEDFWWPAEDTAAEPEAAEPEAEPILPDPEPETSPVFPVSLSSSLSPPPVPPTTFPSAIVVPDAVPVASDVDAADPERDPWGVPISPVPLTEPSRPLFVDEARPGQLPYAPPRRRIPVSAVVAFVLSGVAAWGTVGLLTVPIANADACEQAGVTSGPDAAGSDAPNVAAPEPSPATGTSTIEETASDLTVAEAALSKAEAKATDAEQRLAAARTGLETATAATRVGGVDQSALSAAEAEVTRAASALQAAEAAQRLAATQAARQANAGDWELDMLRAAERERDQFGDLDPSDPYWEDEVVKARRAYEQALVPKQQANSALASANTALATAKSTHATAVSSRNAVSGRNSQAIAQAERQRAEAAREVARAEKAQAQAQMEAVAARENRDELEATLRDLEREQGIPLADDDDAGALAAEDCTEARRGRRTAASIAGGSALALGAVGAGLSVRHRRDRY